MHKYFYVKFNKSIAVRTNINKYKHSTKCGISLRPVVQSVSEKKLLSDVIIYK